MSNILYACSGGIPSNMLLSRKYGLNKQITGELNQYVFSGGDSYRGIFFGDGGTGFSDLHFISITSNVISATYFKNPIDLTNANRIEFTISGYSIGPFMFSIGETTSLGNKTISATSVGTHIIDVSELSGKYYIGLLHNATTPTWGKVSEIILK